MATDPVRNGRPSSFCWATARCGRVLARAKRMCANYDGRLDKHRLSLSSSSAWPTYVIAPTPLIHYPHRCVADARQYLNLCPTFWRLCLFMLPIIKFHCCLRMHKSRLGENMRKNKTLATKLLCPSRSMYVHTHTHLYYIVYVNVWLRLCLRESSF